MSNVTRFWKPVLRHACTLAVMPPAGPESTVATAFLAVAAKAVLGRELPAYSLALWHGINLPLAMSGVALAGGVGRHQPARSRWYLTSSGANRLVTFFSAARCSSPTSSRRPA